ncbi:transcription initiation at TATA-containing promoter protein [Fusarium torreyae]|uniref:Transcription initiation at TATA-containing promoter protein n=1 Tax=Fusarium torreyae TaxID=1237075 RepID=A0A9W8VLK9_9HYPO|nr:transcription initiation at TATA-containing promoter protein [Fusarium torreyae]
MASPTPDAPAPDSKSRDSTAEKEQKSEVNGHATPEKSKDAPESAPVNGNEKTDDHPVENGVSKDVEMTEGSDETKPAVESSTKDDEGEKEGQKSEGDDQAKETGDSKSTEDRPAVTSEDVDMTDAAPADDKSRDDKPAQDKPTDDKVDKESKDVDMLEKPSDAPEKVNGSDEKAPASSNDTAAPIPDADVQPASLSQLAIDTNDAESAAPKPSTEISMQDAPAGDSSATAKVAREREDDATDEPAPKRAKTEPKSEEPADITPAAAPKTETTSAEPASEQGASRLSGLDRWNDADFKNQTLTPFQRREFRKVLGRVKKTKSGAHFKVSVPKLWPQLADSYLAKIEKPTDLSEIDRNLRDANGVYVTVGDFQDDLVLMYNNTRSFNGTLHEVTAAAFNAIRGIWEDVIHIPQEEAVKPKPAPKPKPPRESRIGALGGESAVRKPSVGPGTSPAAESVSSKPRHGSQEANSAAAELRRASIATEGDRPKRTVRAPKSKDIDYTTKPSRKKLKPELQFSEEVLNDLMHPKNQAINSWFMDPVDAEGLNIPHYYSIIKRPMDLGKVSRMLKSGDISSIKEFDKNVRLIFSNCYTFNGSVDQGNTVSYVASQLEGYYNNLMKDKDSWLARHAKANAPAASHGSDDEEEEEEDAEGDEAAAPSGPDPSKEVRELEAKLREESEKLTDLFAADSPNQSMIQIQQTIVKVVQESLLKAKQTLSQYRQKHGGDKPVKKSSKSSKPKPSGSAPRKPSGNAAQPKKSGGSKKAASKKTLTAADKDAIATAINDLDGAQLDRAIDIIKRDTGQNENNDGELELDIDQLSNEALLKLWELCKKVLPGFGKDANAPSSPEAVRSAPKNSKAASTAAKPKKNKPMSAREQEERIAQLRGLRDLYRPGQEPGDAQPVLQAPTPTAESSDESDSEEE